MRREKNHFPHCVVPLSSKSSTLNIATYLLSMCTIEKDDVNAKMKGLFTKVGGLN